MKICAYKLTDYTSNLYLETSNIIHKSMHMYNVHMYL